MRQLKNGSVRGVISRARRSLPITRKGVAGASIVALLGGGAFALKATRTPRLNVGLRCITDGPEGYVTVSTYGRTFLVPASQRPMVETYKGSNELMPITLGVELIDGLRVGTLR